VPNFTPSVQRVDPEGEKPQNRPLSKLSTAGCAARHAAGKRSLASENRSLWAVVQRYLLDAAFSPAGTISALYGTDGQTDGRRTDTGPYHTLR